MVANTPPEQLVDGEGFAVYCDSLITLRRDPLAAISTLRDQHGDRLRLLPISAASAGGGIFQQRAVTGSEVVGLRLEPPTKPRIRRESNPDLETLHLDEIAIDAESGLISIGAALTLEQVNLALAETLGDAWRVPGADLTSYQYAAAGATFMTGGMGPQRRYFSDSVVAAAICDGDRIAVIEGEALDGYAGSYGWSGLVTALRCGFYRYPARELSFALPVHGEATRLAQLLGHLAPFTELAIETGREVTSRWQDRLLLGIEHVSLASMTPLINSAGDQARRALALGETCRAAGGDGVVFITGLSNLADDDFLQSLLDDVDAEDWTIGGVAIEHAEVFADGEQMRQLREAVPYAARMQAPGGRLLYKNHSDANIRLEVDNTASAMESLWRINGDYVDRVEARFREDPKLRGEILVYGHLNPQGVDPHNRVTLGSDDDNAFEACRVDLVELRAAYYRGLAQLCHDSGAEFVGGEKTADSELAIFAALGGPEQAPTALRRRFEMRRATIADAPPMFSWRALPPFV